MNANCAVAALRYVPTCRWLAGWILCGVLVAGGAWPAECAPQERAAGSPSPPAESPGAERLSQRLSPLISRRNTGTQEQEHTAPGRPQQAPTSLAALIAEAVQNNPAILAAEDAVHAAAQMPAQARALPDPHFIAQQFAVGSPRPFAGYTNSDFAYFGLGASQEFPYPGKRGLRSAVAEREADVRRQSAEIVRREEIEKLKEAYYRLAYLQQVLAIHHQHDALVQQIAAAAEIRYRAGQGNQQDILRAQLEHTRVLRDLSMTDQEGGEAQAELKRILNRPQGSPDVVTEPLALTELTLPQETLVARAREENPDVRERAELVRKSQAEVDLARREFRPDFGLSYMWQRTDPEYYRAYYMLTFDVNFPRRKPRQAALAAAEINTERARREQAAQAQAAQAEAIKQIVDVRGSDEQAHIYREGLIPQARAAFEAGMAAYESGREDFQTLLSSAMDVLNLDLEYQQTLLAHQLGIARIERLTGTVEP
jgi:outer membrane protein TolC